MIGSTVVRLVRGHTLAPWMVTQAREWISGFVDQAQQPTLATRLQNPSLPKLVRKSLCYFVCESFPASSHRRAL